MKNGVPILTAALEIAGALVEAAKPVLDGDPQTKPDLNKLLARLLAALATLKGL